MVALGVAHSAIKDSKSNEQTTTLDRPSIGWFVILLV